MPYTYAKFVIWQKLKLANVLDPYTFIYFVVDIRSIKQSKIVLLRAKIV